MNIYDAVRALAGCMSGSMPLDSPVANQLREISECRFDGEPMRTKEHAKLIEFLDRTRHRRTPIEKLNGFEFQTLLLARSEIGYLLEILLPGGVVEMSLAAMKASEAIGQVASGAIGMIDNTLLFREKL
jgi:hypothetical protein